MPKNALCKKETEVQTISTLEVAEMLGKEHFYILREIEGSKDGKTVGIIPTLLNANFAVSDYFTESTYKDKSGKSNKCYLVTKMGCELLGNKQQGEKGIIFTAKYVKRFNDMEQAFKEKQHNPPTSNLAELIKFIQLTREQMKEQGCSPREIAKVTQEICNQYGIQLPKYFIKPEETTLKEVYEMIDYICDQPRGRGIRRPNYEDFIAHQINVKLIGG